MADAEAPENSAQALARAHIVLDLGRPATMSRLARSSSSIATAPFQ
jgi:hypothetical protein